MPFDATKLDELKANVAFARKRPMAFGLCLGKTGETTVLLNHKSKDPETVGRMAKKEGETTKIAFGMMTVEAKNLNLMCHGDLIPGLARKTKEMLKAAGMKMKVRILDAAGNVLEEQGDDDEEDGPADPPGAAPDEAPAPDPQRDKWDQTRPRIEEGLTRLAASGKTRMDEITAAWRSALDRAVDQDFAAALEGAAATARLIAAAIEAQRVAEAERARWLAAEAKLRPVIEGLVRSTAPEVKKLTAYWSFAQSKVAAPVPDFASAMKTVALVVKLIGDIRAKGQGGSSSPAAPGATQTPGGASGATPAPGGPAAPAPQPRTNGAPPVNAEENARLKGMTDEALAKEDLTTGDTKALFGKDYMLKLKDAKIKGEGSPNLKKLMQEVAKGLSPARREQVMNDLSQIVGVPPTAEKLGEDYDRFVQVQRQQAAIGKQKNKDEVPPLDEDKHPDFMASRSQLMFGKVLGDAFGIHEVFAALLSPTGGLVGADNKSLHLAADNPIAIHGTVHDAAGYLGSYHKEGPGYNYLESGVEALIFDNIPLPDYLAGQMTGVPFWIKEAGADYVEKRVDAVVVEVEKQLKTARDAVASEIDKRLDQARRAGNEAFEAAKKAAKALERKADETAEDARKAAAELERRAKEARDRAAAELDLRVAEAKRKAAEAVRNAERMVKKAEQKATEIADAVMETPAKVEKAATRAIDTAKKNLGEVKDEAKRKLEAAWDFIWS